MRISKHLKQSLSASLFAVVLTFGLTGSCDAESAVIFTRGIVDVDRDGIVSVLVCLDGACESYIPSNGHGLLISGRILPGDEVDVKITQDRKRPHRGHVTVLK